MDKVNFKKIKNPPDRMIPVIRAGNKGPVQYRRRKSSGAGFVILFAVTLSAILLSIALGVANIAQKEIRFGTSARDTNDSFLASDTGAECALFYDKLSGSSFPIAGPATAINCASTSITPSFSGTADAGSYSFIIPGLGSLATSCVKVNVLKDNSVSPILVSITSTGYNIGDAGCNSTNPNRVERELKITSYIGVPPPPPPAAPVLTWTGPTNGSQSMPTNSTLPFTTPGTYTITVDKALTVNVSGVAGGGGGASSWSGDFGGGSGGGGGASDTTGESVNLVPGTTYELQIGAAGQGGSSNSNGSAGGTTRFRISGSTTYLQLGGGGGGQLNGGSSGAGGSVVVGAAGIVGGSGGRGGMGNTNPNNLSFECTVIAGAGGNGPAGGGGGGGGGGQGFYGISDGCSGGSGGYSSGPGWSAGGAGGSGGESYAIGGYGGHGGGNVLIPGVFGGGGGGGARGYPYTNYGGGSGQNGAAVFKAL